jgi:hypothetical protein
MLTYADVCYIYIYIHIYIYIGEGGEGERPMRRSRMLSDDARLAQQLQGEELSGRRPAGASV